MRLEVNCFVYGLKPFAAVLWVRPQGAVAVETGFERKKRAKFSL